MSVRNPPAGRAARTSRARRRASPSRCRGPSTRLVRPSPAAIAVSRTTVPFSEMPLRTSRWDGGRGRPGGWAAFDEPDGGDERRVEDRDREHEQRDERGDRRLRDLPARRQAERPSVSPITWLPESPMKTAAGFRGRKLKGRKPATASARASETTSRGRRVDPDGVDGEEERATTARLPASPSMLSRRLKAFVIATSHRRPRAVAAMPLSTISTRMPDARRLRLRRTARRASRAAAGSAGRRSGRRRTRSPRRRRCPRAPTSARSRR